MGNEVKLPYFTGNSADKYEFIRIPKILLNPPFDNMTNDERILYGLFLDRLSCSLHKNQKEFTDKDGKLFIIYTRKDLMDIFNWGNHKVANTIKRLVELGLIEDVQVGLNKPNKIYPKDISSIKYRKCEKSTSRNVKSATPELSETATQESNSNTSQEVMESHSSNNNSSNNNSSNTNDKEIKAKTSQENLKPSQLELKELGFDYEDRDTFVLYHHFTNETKSIMKTKIINSFNEYYLIDEHIKKCKSLISSVLNDGYKVFLIALRYTTYKYRIQLKKRKIKCPSAYFNKALDENIKISRRKCEIDNMSDEELEEYYENKKMEMFLSFYNIKHKSKLTLDEAKNDYSFMDYYEKSKQIGGK